jgi:DNA-binding IclR family transcriptional regulator
VIDLLRRADGATIVDLSEATGWLPHTTRAALTGLRKRGYAVVREEVGLEVPSTGTQASAPTEEIAP